MKTGWKVVLIIVAVALVIGAVSIGVGFMTGGNPERIIPAIDTAMEYRYGINIGYIMDNYQNIIAEFSQMLPTI